MVDTEGALNVPELSPAGASPAPEVQNPPFLETRVVDDPEEFARLEGEALQSADHDRVSLPHLENADAASAGQDDAAGSESAKVVKAEGNSGAPGPIPYERFKEVNEKAQEFERKARELEGRQMLLARAAGAGFPTIEGYQTANAWARANNFGSIEAYQAWQEDQRQLSQYSEQLSRREDLSDTARQDLIASRQQYIETQRMQRELNEQVQSMRVQTLEQAIESARAHLGPLDPDLERILRQSSPAVVQLASAALKRQMDLVAAPLQAQIEHIKAQTKRAVENGKAEYAATKLRQQQIPAPEGRGGQPPAPARDTQPNGWRRSSFAELIFGQHRTG
jgi:hypothetical protein